MGWMTRHVVAMFVFRPFCLCVAWRDMYWCTATELQC
jgi:hypothetical protein